MQPRVGRADRPDRSTSSRAVIAATGLVAFLGLMAGVAINAFGDTRPAIGPGPSSARTPAAFPPTAAGLPIVSVGTAQRRRGRRPGRGGAGRRRLVHRGSPRSKSCRPSLQPVGTCVSDWSRVLEVGARRPSGAATVPGIRSGRNRLGHPALHRPDRPARRREPEPGRTPRGRSAQPGGAHRPLPRRPRARTPRPSSSTRGSPARAAPLTEAAPATVRCRARS